MQDCQDAAWGVDGNEKENIFQLCRVLALVFHDCTITDQLAANTSCSHRTPPPVENPSPISSTSCENECSDAAGDWCRYSAVYVVFCSQVGVIAPGTTLEAMQSLVNGKAEDCTEEWLAKNRTLREGDDDGESESSLLSGSDTAVGGALSALLGDALVVRILVKSKHV